MRALPLRALALLAGALFAACYSPTYERLLCGEGADPCPDGYACVGGMCLQDLEECGDGVRHAPDEACDDGNLVTETACPYGQPTCTMCNSGCTQSLSLFGRYCGDRVVEPGVEACDDGNALQCGSCSADCQMNLVPTAATGMLMNVASLSSANEGQYFGLFDGSLPNYLGFEIDINNSVQGGFVRVDLSASTPVPSVIAAINGSAISINATDAGGGNVRLVNQLLSGRGNGEIMTNIPAPFAVMGMSGGAGGDCLRGTGCTNAGVCSSNSCTNSTCD
jgi:cysteine-rich repeat protein